MLIEMLDANEDGEVDSFEWTTMLSQVVFLYTQGYPWRVVPIFCLIQHLYGILLSCLIA